MDDLRSGNEESRHCHTDKTEMIQSSTIAKFNFETSGSTILEKNVIIEAYYCPVCDNVVIEGVND